MHRKQDRSPDIGGAATDADGPRIVNVDNDDENFVNDNGQTSGDIFQQNAQDQSTASGAGT
ncbi:hypothetical protein [Mycobacterium stomatepiae]|uniref:Uncharacterized protein n=1 Tax=Mycobacterium stomatepiae TaxID=470076 RepID=A0A7I7QE58_9MYCO|nr:hypothetical protein [Mycobacterium stomatepiae]MCV7167305.1 hypothetical protein [Mycobacterium stomatepiae]BBY24624.1 hypothetical protein MSTO_48290 [Mycobacterium stomatepiae]